MSLVVLFGSAPGGTTHSYTGAGGYVLAGAGATVKGKSYAGQGGLTFAGAAARARVHAVAPAGGVSFAGGAALAKGRTWSAAGGIMLAGAGLVAKARIASSSGGFVLAGAAITSAGATFTYVAAGGVVLSGAAATSAGAAASYAYTGSGGWQFVGAADCSYADGTRIEFVPAGIGVPIRRGQGIGRRGIRKEGKPPAAAPVVRRLIVVARIGLGGAAITSFEPVPVQAIEIIGRAYAGRLSGAARVQFHDQAAYAGAVNERELLELV